MDTVEDADHDPETWVVPVGTLLYVYRVLLTGLHLVRAGEVEANLERLDEDARLPQLPDLLARKRAGPEQGALADADLAFHEAEVRRLTGALEEAMTASRLPDLPLPGARAALNEVIIDLRRPWALNDAMPRAPSPTMTRSQASSPEPGPSPIARPRARDLPSQVRS